MSCMPNVEFKIVTPDGLRMVLLGLVKSCQADDIEVWTINLKVAERAGTQLDFQTIGNTSEVVGQEDNAGAETIAHNGALFSPEGAGSGRG